MRNSNIKTMKLYNYVERIFNEIREIGKNNFEKLNVEELINFDQLHYCGVEALNFSIEKLSIDSNMSILEIGSGIGGPARYIADKTGATITALEIQPDQNKIALNLTKRCDLNKKVIHVCGDILNYEWGNKKFDGIVSWLSLFHIHNHKALLKKCFDLLNSGGFFYSEDLISLKLLSNNEIIELSTELFAHYLPDYQSYNSELNKYGFKLIFHQNMTDIWSQFTRDRKTSYINQKDRHLRVHGEEIYNNLNSFYTFIDQYFSSGKLGGIRVIARKD